MVDTNRFNAPITACHASFADKAALLNALWGTQHSPKALQTGEIDSGPYLEYYSQQCDIFCLEQSTYSPADGASGYEITTHQDILRIVERLATQSQDRQELSHCWWTSRPQPTKLENGESWPHPSQNSAPNHVIHNSIDWAARLLTMMEIGQPHCAFSARRPLVWSKASLRAFVANQLEPEKRDNGYVRLPKIFTARNLELLGGIKIAWTNNLADHLSLRDDDKTVLIFHHATFLENSHT
ncbi:hypothetical protein SLS56_008775 [Neofusicoccum ribis]|uniref:Uncharacterized protein n=1 Tax=Neofusicoccum ribis TaxID=45134 RepID=A0ABR3SJ72_9PEZI